MVYHNDDKTINKSKRINDAKMNRIYLEKEIKENQKEMIGTNIMEIKPD